MSVTRFTRSVFQGSYPIGPLREGSLNSRQQAQSTCGGIGDQPRVPQCQHDFQLPVLLLGCSRGSLPKLRWALGEPWLNSQCSDGFHRVACVDRFGELWCGWDSYENACINKSQKSGAWTTFVPSTRKIRVDVSRGVSPRVSRGGTRLYATNSIKRDLVVLGHRRLPYPSQSRVWLYLVPATFTRTN